MNAMTNTNWKSLLAVIAAGTLAISGCSGADGKDGANGQDGQDGATGPTGPTGPTGATGPTGPTGPKGDPGTPAPVSLTENCAGCHMRPAANHALSDQLGVVVTVDPVNAVAIAANLTDLTVTFNVKVNGVARFDFNQKAATARNHVEDAFWVYSATPTYSQAAPNNTGPAGVRTKIQPAQWSFATYQNGNIVATLPGFATTPPAPGTAYMLSVMNPAGVTATAVAFYQGKTHDAVSDEACINCHGQLVWRDAAHDVTYPQGVGPCVVCHNRVGSADPRLPGAGTGLMGIVHGIHNSHNMPDGQYTFTWTNGNKFNFSLGFPGYMNNCSTCHSSTAQLAAINAAVPTYELCMSCHDDWEGFAATKTGAAMHTTHVAITALNAGTTALTTCTNCHPTATAKDFHNGLKTERAGLLWDGEDQAVKIGATINLAITEVAVAGTNLNVKWTATMGGVAVDPCNATVGAAAPVFFGATANTATGQVASNMSMIRSYMQGDDWVGSGTATSPGQPLAAVTLTSTNTTCAANVATTVLPVEATTGFTRGTVALQGKPQVTFAAAPAASSVIQVRAVSPTREFVLATGAAPAAARRQVADMVKCLDCHKGSMYQHGGNRVDSMELCIVCHNPASSEMQNRVNMGVDATEAYDFQAGQTYDMRTMVHAIHSAGETGKSLVYYRSNGIYFFGTDAALAAVTNWPKTGGVSCKNAEGATVTYYKVYGSTATGTVPEANTDGTCKTTGLATSTDGTWRIHNYIPVHYPRPLNDCSACHVAGSVDLQPDPLKAVAVTMENAGASPWGNLLDDVLVGPSAASCMTCHRSGDPAIQKALLTHASVNGIVPAAFANGRQTLIDAAK